MEYQFLKTGRALTSSKPKEPNNTASYPFAALLSNTVGVFCSVLFFEVLGFELQFHTS